MSDTVIKILESGMSIFYGGGVGQFGWAHFAGAGTLCPRVPCDANRCGQKSLPAPCGTVHAHAGGMSSFLVIMSSDAVLNATFPATYIRFYN